MPNMPFESQVANTAHEQWLFSEAQKMLGTKGLGAETLCTWQGSVYGAFDIESDDIYERAEQDWGLSQLGEKGEEELPSLIIQSCWAHEYQHMFNEMQEWIKRGAGAVQMAVLLKWTLEIPEPGADPVLHSEIEVFEYAPKTEAQYTRTFHEKVSSTEEKELQSVKITSKQLFSGHKPRGRGASYALSLTDLWYTALDIFDVEVDEWNAQGQPLSAAAEGSEQVATAVQEEYGTDEEEGSEVDDVQNGADERLRGTGTSVSRYELTTDTTAIATGVLPTANASQVADYTESSKVVYLHTEGAAGEDALMLESGEEGTTQHVVTTTQITTVVHQSSPHSIEPSAGASKSVNNTSHAEEFAGVNETHEQSRESVAQATSISTFVQGNLEILNHEAVFETDSGSDSDDTFDSQRAAMARMATLGNGVRSSNVYKEILTKGGTEPVTESHTEEFTITEHTSTLPSGSSEHFQESVTQSSYMHEESVEEVFTPLKTSRLEVSITQDSGSAHAKTDTFEVSYDQTLTLQQGTSTSVDSPCPHCLSSQCCHGPQSPLKHLPRDFMSAGVIGPFSWCGFVVYLSLSTLQSAPEEAIEKGRPTLINRIQEFTEEIHEDLHEEFPPEDVGPLTVITMEHPTTGKTTITTETVVRLRKKRDRNSGVEVPIKASPGGSSSEFTQTTKTVNRLMTESPEPGTPLTDVSRGMFQSPDPKSTPWGLAFGGNTTQVSSQQWMGSGGPGIFPSFAPRPDSPKLSAEISGVTNMHETVTATNSPDENVDRTKAVTEKKDEVTTTTKAEEPLTPKDEPTGLGIIIESQQPATLGKAVTTHIELGPRATEKVVRTEAVISQETTTTSKSGASPKVEDGDGTWQIVTRLTDTEIVTGVTDAERGATIGHGGTITTRESEELELIQTQTITTDDPKARGGSLPKSPTKADVSPIGRKHSTTTEETTQTVEHRFVVPEVVTEAKKVTVVTGSTEDGYLLQQTVESSKTVSGTEAEVATGSSNLIAPVLAGLDTIPTKDDYFSESDGEEQKGDDTFLDDKPGSHNLRPVHPALNPSFPNESVQSFESFESLPGPEDKTKKRRKRDKVINAVTKAFDAVKPPRLGRHKGKVSISLGRDKNASDATEDTTVTDQDIESHGELFPPAGDDFATIPPRIVSQMQQKLNLGPAENTVSPPIKRVSSSRRRSTLLERPKSLLQRAHSTANTPTAIQAEGEGNTFNRDELLIRKGSQSITTTTTRSERRLSDDSMFFVSDNESIETAPPLTPGLGSEMVIVNTGKEGSKIVNHTRAKGKSEASDDNTNNETAPPLTPGEMDNVITGKKTRTVKRGRITGKGEVSESDNETESSDSEIHKHGHGGTEAHNHENTAITTSTTVVHASNCQYSQSTGLGFVHCDCGGDELTKYQAADPPESISTADLMAQLQSLLTQIQGRTGKVVVPRARLGVNMTCEITEKEEEEIEVEVEVRVKYKSKKSMEHVGFCERTRGILGAGGTCPIIEEMRGRN